MLIVEIIDVVKKCFFVYGNEKIIFLVDIVMYINDLEVFLCDVLCLIKEKENVVIVFIDVKKVIFE